jgi:hypothetical protein
MTRGDPVKYDQGVRLNTFPNVELPPSSQFRRAFPSPIEPNDQVQEEMSRPFPNQASIRISLRPTGEAVKYGLLAALTQFEHRPAAGQGAAQFKFTTQHFGGNPFLHLHHSGGK